MHESPVGSWGGLTPLAFAAAGAAMWGLRHRLDRLATHLGPTATIWLDAEYPNSGTGRAARHLA